MFVNINIEVNKMKPMPVEFTIKGTGHNGWVDRDVFGIWVDSVVRKSGHHNLTFALVVTHNEGYVVEVMIKDLKVVDAKNIPFETLCLSKKGAK